MMSISRIRTVLAKEIVDNARDRKACSTAALYVVMGPFLLLGVLSLAGRMLADENTRAIEVPVVGAALAPSLVEYLKQRSLIPVPGPSDPETAVRERVYPAVLVISPTYARDLTSARSATVQVLHDSSQRHGLNQTERLLEALHGYGAAVGRLRLLARGIDPNVVSPLAVESADLATPCGRAAILLGSIPVFLLLALFVGGMYIAIDTTAGERERGSLEPLLINPLTPAEVILGKFGAVALYSGITTLLSLIGFSLVLNQVPIDIPGIRTGLSLTGFLWLAAILLPAVFLATALQLRVASVSRTFKEAQTAGQLLLLLPAIPGLLEIVGSVQFSGWKLAPIFGQHLLVDRVLTAEPVSLRDYGWVSLGTLALGLLLLLNTIHRYDRARVLFG